MRRSMRAALCAIAIGAATLGPAAAGISVSEAAVLTCNDVFVYQDANVPRVYPSWTPYNCQLIRGDKGEGVEQLQNSIDTCYNQLLHDHGLQPLKVDGDFGSKTQAALKVVQAASGTAADGEYGPKTRLAMEHQKTSGDSCKRIT